MFERNSFPHRFIFLALAVLVSSFLSAPESKAQTVTVTLQGTVYDTKGAVVPGVEVVVRNVETGQERNLKTNDDGSYSASFMQLGRYKITASGAGFSSATKEDI